MFMKKLINSIQEKCKLLTLFKDMIADKISNKRVKQQSLNYLFVVENKIFYFFYIKKSCFSVLRDVRLYCTYHFFKNIHNKSKPQHVKKITTILD